MTPVGVVGATTGQPDHGHASTRGEIARSRPVLYPAILATTWVLSLYVATSVSPYAAIRVILVALLLGLVAAWLGGIALGDRHRGGFVGLLAIVAILYGGRVEVLALVAIAAVLVVVAGRTASSGRGRLRWPMITRAMTAVAAIFLLAVGIKAVQTGNLTATIADLVADRPFLRSSTSATAPAGAPDIYVILLDSHARADWLMERFGVDATPFTAGLEARGFDVAPESRSNYLLTQLTLASMLNNAHLDALDGPVGLASSDVAFHRETRNLINDNVVFDLLRAKGYDITSIAPGWEDAAIRGADHFIDTGPVEEFEVVALHSTALWGVLERLAPQLLIDAGRARIERSVDRLVEAATEPAAGPRLVIAHLSAPHPPFVMGSINALPGDLAQEANYEITGEAPMTDDQYIERYAAQVRAVDELVIETVDRLDAVIDPGSVVVVLSDHGSRSSVDWSDLQPSDLDERSAILFAARSPGHPGLFGPAPTPVNLFGTILQTYLGETVPRQADDVYYWEGEALFDTVRVDALSASGTGP